MRFEGELDFAAQIVESAHESLDSSLGAVAVAEVLGAEILVFDAVLEHVVGGSQNRSGDREGSFLAPRRAFKRRN